MTKEPRRSCSKPLHEICTISDLSSPSSNLHIHLDPSPTISQDSTIDRQDTAQPHLCLHLDTPMTMSVNPTWAGSTVGRQLISYTRLQRLAGVAQVSPRGTNSDAFAAFPFYQRPVSARTAVEGPDPGPRHDASPARRQASLVDECLLFQGLPRDYHPYSNTQSRHRDHHPSHVSVSPVNDFTRTHGTARADITNPLDHFCTVSGFMKQHSGIYLCVDFEDDAGSEWLAEDKAQSVNELAVLNFWARLGGRGGATGFGKTQVLRILGSRQQQNGDECQYLVHWVGYSVRESAWVDREEALVTALDKVAEFGEQDVVCTSTSTWVLVTVIEDAPAWALGA
ncbi:hypothetical protein FZEAL_10280 [Fusarium zealandicum]|uniref:Chromo domain-containing protein n=1 Tax=Fusarium zealandicum TaxID=1053134 RepID=A0A8H4XCI3_9HYPO|nr:hypothetical protein FZEAL_10280 [Fusarium zealandicum]